MSDTWEAKLEEARKSPLYEGLSKYQHVQRLGHKEVEGLLDGVVWVQEKVDGANATIANVDGKLVVASRNQAISVGGDPPTGFRGLVQYVVAHEGIKRLVAEGLVLRGEWLVHHSLRYKSEAYGRFYVFDVEYPNPHITDWRKYLTPEEYEPRLLAAGIDFVPTVGKIVNPTPEHLVEILMTDSQFGAPMREGIVIKRYDFVNQYGRTQWAKMIHADFKQQNSIHFKAPKDADAEVRFVSRAVTPALVQKNIAKVAAEKQEDPAITHMAAVLGRVWHDAFTEELWDFVTRQRVAGFDFRTAQKLAINKARDLALATYNGFPTIHGEEMQDYLADTTRTVAEVPS